MKVAIVYDRVNKWGGAERVLLALHRIFPKAPLYTSVYDPKNAHWAKVFKIHTSFIQRIPAASSHNEWFPFLMPTAFESFDFSEFDLVISVTSESAKGIITTGKTRHLCICLTPTRYLWSGYDTYFKSNIVKALTLPLITYLRRWDIKAAKRPDKIIAISKEVQKRIKKYYGRDSELVYPPIETIDRGSRKKKENYFLLVSRLSKFVTYKRVDLVIDSFNKWGRPLKIVGTGSLEKALKARSKKNIEFLGMVSDEELERLYKGAKALVFPAIEDFGLVMAEAQFYGTPVIAYRKGGALEIVKEGVTGEFFSKQTKESLLEVLKKFEQRRYNMKAIKENASRFSFQQFEKELKNSIKEII